MGYRSNVLIRAARYPASWRPRPRAQRSLRRDARERDATTMGSDVGGKPAGSSRDGIGAASTSKRRRIESLEQRFAGGALRPRRHPPPGDPSPAPALGAGAAAPRPDRFAPRPPRRRLLGPRGGGRGAPPARPRDDRARPDLPGRVPDDDPSPPTPVWYAPLGPRARTGVMASAHARAIPDLARCRDDADRSPAGRGVAWVLGLIRELAATNPKAGAGVEQVIQSKTKDKSLLLDAANARFSVDEVRAAKERRETRERRRGGSASARATRAKSGAPIIPTTGDGDGDGDGALDHHRAPPRVLVVVRGDGGRMRRGREGTRGERRDEWRRETREGAVAAVSCRDPGLTGTRGTIVRDTARSGWSRLGTGIRWSRFRNEGRRSGGGARAEQETRQTRRGGIVPVPAHGGVAPTMAVTVRGDNLARVG